MKNNFIKPIEGSDAKKDDGKTFTININNDNTLNKEFVDTFRLEGSIKGTEKTIPVNSVMCDFYLKEAIEAIQSGKYERIKIRFIYHGQNKDLLVKDEKNFLYVLNSLSCAINNNQDIKSIYIQNNAFYGAVEVQFLDGKTFNIQEFIKSFKNKEVVYAKNYSDKMPFMFRTLKPIINNFENKKKLKQLDKDFGEIVKDNTEYSNIYKSLVVSNALLSFCFFKKNHLLDKKPYIDQYHNVVNYIKPFVNKRFAKFQHESLKDKTILKTTDYIMSELTAYYEAKQLLDKFITYYQKFMEYQNEIEGSTKSKSNYLFNYYKLNNKGQLVKFEAPKNITDWFEKHEYEKYLKNKVFYGKDNDKDKNNSVAKNFYNSKQQINSFNDL